MVWALVDTGAASSLINEDIYNSLKFKGQVRGSDDVELYDISNKKLKTSGRVTLKFKFGDIDNLEQDFVIIDDMKPSCILGMDAIEKHEFIIDGKLRTVYRVIMDKDGEKEMLLANPYEICVPPFTFVSCALTDTKNNDDNVQVRGHSEIQSKARQSTLDLSESTGINGLDLDQGKESTICNAKQMNLDVAGLKWSQIQEGKLISRTVGTKQKSENSQLKTKDRQMDRVSLKVKMIQSVNMINSQQTPQGEIIKEIEEKKFLREEMLFTKAPNCPEGLEIILRETRNGNLILFVNTSNKIITLQGSKVLGHVNFPTSVLMEDSNGKYYEQNKKLFVNSVLATQKIDLSKVPIEHTAELRLLLQKYSDIFAGSSYDIEKTSLIEHSIDTEGKGPIRHRSYRTPLKLQDELKRHINEMIKHGIIQESRSPWAAPVLLVKKANTTETRFVTDYRSLNKITKHDSFPMPLVSSILEQLGNKNFFSTIDLASGFFQIPMRQDSIEKTAFICEQGLFEYLSCPMGLRNSPSTMCRLLLNLFKDLIGKYVLLYG